MQQITEHENKFVILWLYKLFVFDFWTWVQSGGILDKCPSKNSWKQNLKCLKWALERILTYILLLKVLKKPSIVAAMMMNLDITNFKRWNLIKD